MFKVWRGVFHDGFIGRPFVKRLALRYQTAVYLSRLSVCEVGVLWPNSWMDQDETWHGNMPRPQPHCVRWGPSSPSPKEAQPPQFSAHVCCGQTAGWIKMPLGTEVDLGPGDIVLDGNPAPPKNRGHSTPNFGPCIVAKRLHVSRCHLVRGLASTQVTLCYMGTQLPPKRGTAAPNFWSMSVVAKRLNE